MDALKLGLDEGDKEWPSLAVLGNTIEQSEVCRKHDILLQINFADRTRFFSISGVDCIYQ